MIETPAIGKKKKNNFISFKAFLFFLLSLPLIFFPGCSLSKKATPVETSANRTEALIIDHTCTNINNIPEYWIKKARAEFGISYGHTSHGSQLITGMTGLVNFKGDSQSWKPTL